MEINIPHPQLMKALELASRISTKHVTLPILQCALIEADEERITVKATNLELSIEVEIAGEIKQVGKVAVPMQTFMQSVQYINQASLTLRVEEGGLLIESRQTKTNIKTMALEDFPNTYHLEGEEIVINRPLFSLGIKTTAFAASQSAIKPELGSVFIQQNKEQSLTFVSTDSFRLMEKVVPQKGVVLDKGLLIPQKNAIELARVCDLLEKDPALVVSENQCALDFKEEGVYIISRLVSGTFPDYQQIIPKEFATHVTVLKSDLTNAFRKTSVFLNKFQQVTLSIMEDSLTIASNNAEVGQITDSVKALVEGEGLSLNFNQQYLIEPLSHITDDSVIMHFAGIGRPLVITGVSNQTLRYLVMPMNR